MRRRPVDRSRLLRPKGAAARSQRAVQCCRRLKQVPGDEWPSQCGCIGRGSYYSSRRFHNGLPCVVIHARSSAAVKSGGTTRYQMRTLRLSLSATFANAFTRQVVCCPPFARPGCAARVLYVEIVAYPLGPNRARSGARVRPMYTTTPSSCHAYRPASIGSGGIVNRANGPLPYWCR